MSFKTLRKCLNSKLLLIKNSKSVKWWVRSKATQAQRTSRGLPGVMTRFQLTQQRSMSQLWLRKSEGPANLKLKSRCQKKLVSFVFRSYSWFCSLSLFAQIPILWRLKKIMTLSLRNKRDRFQSQMPSPLHLPQRMSLLMWLTLERQARSTSRQCPKLSSQCASSKPSTRLLLPKLRLNQLLNWIRVWQKNWWAFLKSILRLARRKRREWSKSQSLSTQTSKN